MRAPTALTQSVIAADELFECEFSVAIFCIDVAYFYCYIILVFDECSIVVIEDVVCLRCLSLYII